MPKRHHLLPSLLLATTLCACGGDSAPVRDGGAGDGRVGSTDGRGGGTDAAGCANPAPYYPDKDGDGHGDVSAAAVSACSKPADHSASKTDCADGDDRAYPGQTAFFDQPIKGSAADPWDFNCDAAVETKASYPVNQCANKGYTICNKTFTKSWWGTKPPACGETRKLLVSCTFVGGALDGTCEPNFDGEETQLCR